MEIWVSALAATLTTAAFVPQALHIIRYKETKAISLVMYVAFAAGVAFWMLFGTMIGNWPIIVSNFDHARACAGHHRDEASDLGERIDQLQPFVFGEHRHAEVLGIFQF